MSRFTCQIPIDPKGYRWENEGGYGLEDGEELYERSLSLLGNSEEEIWSEWHEKGSAALPGETYDPFVVEPALYRIFAALEVRPEAILQFVHKYGSTRTVFDVIERTETNSLEEWRRRIEELREANTVADEYVSSQSTRGRRRDRTAALDLVNESLGWAELHATAVLRQNGAIDVRIAAHDLWSVMRLQLAEAIIDQKHYRECEYCQKPFEVSPQVNRSDRLFCSDNCRVKAYHRRKRQAIDMRNAGKPLREIAKVTQSDLDSVKKWISADGKRKSAKR